MGRPPGPPEKVRRNRVTVLLTDPEVAKLHRVAEERGVPIGTAAHILLTQALARQR